MCFSIYVFVCVVCFMFDCVGECLLFESYCVVFVLCWVFLLANPCMVFQRVCVLCLGSQCVSRYSLQMSDLCSCVRDVISEFNSEIKG